VEAMNLASLRAFSSRSMPISFPVFDISSRARSKVLISSDTAQRAYHSWVMLLRSFSNFLYSRVSLFSDLIFESRSN